MTLASTVKLKNTMRRPSSIRKEIYGENHCDVAASYNNLAIVHSDLGQYSEAKEYYEKALMIKKKDLRWKAW